jgi:hypothetical protein
MCSGRVEYADPVSDCDSCPSLYRDRSFWEAWIYGRDRDSTASIIGAHHYQGHQQFPVDERGATTSYPNACLHSMTKTKATVLEEVVSPRQWILSAYFLTE